MSTRLDGHGHRIPMPPSNMRTWPENLSPTTHDHLPERCCPDIGLHDAHPWAEQSFEPFRKVTLHWSQERKMPYALERREIVRFYSCPGCVTNYMTIVSSA